MYHTLVLLLIITCVPAVAQDDASGWTRNESSALPPLELFHSTQVINLPTATRLHAGEMEFEISHRFIPTVKDGIKSLYGFDGPVNIRIALGYAFSDNGIVTLGRSNLQDNLDLNVKHTLLTLRHDFVPLHVAARAGAAISTEIPGREAWDADNLQTYVQFIANTLIGKRIGLGVVPSYLFNSHIECVETQYSLTLGLHAQYYITDSFNVLAEWNPTLSGWREGYNAMSFGIELETGGHFFKIIMSNSDLLNPAQFLAGAPDSFSDGAWRIGFNITRILIF
ncbi:MAG: hypothetical protein KFH87_08030 [Bacteroidetes bacterium]|nr:hypothetical protein [Bacteroidota bacterium]